MSARIAIVRPGLPPFRMPTTPVCAMPVCTSMPSAFSFFATSSPVRVSRFESSGFLCMSWRSATAVPEYFATSAEISASVGLSAEAPATMSRPATAARVGRTNRMDIPLVNLSSEQLARDVAESLELERIAARVGQEHRRLLAGLSPEANVRLDDERRAGLPQARGEGLPVRHLEHHAEVRHGHVMAVDRVVRGPAGAVALHGVANELVPEEVEVDPVGRASTLGAAEDPAVECARAREVAHRDGEVKGRHGQAASFASIEISARRTLLNGQLALAFSAAAMTFARSAPGAFTVTSRCTCVMLNPLSCFSSVTVAPVSIFSGLIPASPRLCVRAIVKQPACAAPSSSSGFVPGVASKRVANE